MIKEIKKKWKEKTVPAIVVNVIHKLDNELDSVFPSVAFGIDHFAVNEKHRIKTMEVELYCKGYVIYNNSISCYQWDT